MYINLIDYEVMGFYAYPSAVLAPFLMLEQTKEWDVVEKRLIKEAQDKKLESPDEYHTKPGLDNKIAFKLENEHGHQIFIGFRDGEVRIGHAVGWEYRGGRKEEWAKGAEIVAFEREGDL